MQSYVLSEDCSFIFHQGELSILKRKSLFGLFLANCCSRVTSLDFSDHISVGAVCDIKKDNPEQKFSEQEVSGQSSAQVARKQQVPESEVSHQVQAQVRDKSTYSGVFEE